MSETLAEVKRLEEFAEAYRRWMKEKVDPEGEFGYLLNSLFELEFVWIVPFDENRAEDGIYLRMWFESESGMECKDSYLEWPCSMLEMLLGLAIKIEDTVMYDPDEGDRTATWFWMMLENLGVAKLDDRAWLEDPAGSSRYLDDVVDTLLNRRYDADGSNGGLFPQLRSIEDQRDLEIWHQMNLYMTTTKGYGR